jgi:predicted DNA binding CopG/RHH family protein
MRRLDAGQETVRTTLRLTNADLAAADRVAAQRGITRSELLRAVLTAHIANEIEEAQAS